MIDLSSIPERHQEINRRLEEWALYLRETPRLMSAQPMFRMYQSKSRQWDPEPYIPVQIDTIAAHAVEKAVSTLPEQQREVIRWAYIWPWVQEHRIRRKVGATRTAMVEIINSARDMLKNRLTN